MLPRLDYFAEGIDIGRAIWFNTPLQAPSADKVGAGSVKRTKALRGTKPQKKEKQHVAEIDSRPEPR